MQTSAAHNFLNDALDGQVVVSIGQVSPVMRAVMDRAVRAGKLAKWRGKWFPLAGAPFGLGPDKTCWSTPEVAAQFAEMKHGIEARLTS